MAFGRLFSHIPEKNKNFTLYSSQSGELIQGKISVTHKNFNPIKIRIGISTDEISSKYINYNTILGPGQSLETDDIYFGNGQHIIVRASDPDVNFVLIGEVIEDNNDSSILNSVRSTENKRKILYQCPADTSVEVNVIACNLDAFESRCRIGISSSGLEDYKSSDYVEYNFSLDPNENVGKRNIKLSNGQSILCSSDDNSFIDFVVFGKFIEESLPPNTFSELKVLGNADFDGSVNVTGVITASAINGNIDASNLFGEIPENVQGSNLKFRSNNSLVGSAKTVSFNQNLNFNITNEIANVRLSDNVSINQNATVGGTLSVGGTINTLNNRVTNVAEPSDSKDAANKKYVDTKSIVMSIALS
jgi:hypothetical protein